MFDDKVKGYEEGLTSQCIYKPILPQPSILIYNIRSKAKPEVPLLSSGDQLCSSQSLV